MSKWRISLLKKTIYPETLYKPEASNTSVDSFIQEIHQLRSDVFLTLIQIMKTSQFAISHVLWIVVVDNRARFMEMLSVVRHLIIFVLVRVCSGDSSAMSIVQIAGHVIQDSVYVNSDTSFVASCNHIDKFFFRAGSRSPKVGNWLVTFPPWPVSDHQILL